MNKGLTVFLGGAGMNGNYQDDMVKALRAAGIANPVYGNYSGWANNIEKPNFFPTYVDSADTLADASAVLFYNQDYNDPIALQLVNTNDCKIEGSRSIFGLVLNSYSGRNARGEDCPQYTIRYELSTPRPTDFSLHNLDIRQLPPSSGQFNFIGYSWGAVIAARSSIYHSIQGKTIDHLVLIGAPINKSLLTAVRTNKRIKKVIVINLTEQGDEIYAGMSDNEIINTVPVMKNQMQVGDIGHFYYAGENPEGSQKRLRLANKLYRAGLR
ncbi:hypothetical protein [Marinomonas gallaica]|uniref:hypothetical protein n=1 Tax=Marinomonas gallaica TaxID=1806667 RepID=UPI003A907EBE